MADAVLTRDGPVPVPLDYVVPQGGELAPLTVRAVLDGTSAASEFYGIVEVIAPSGRSMGKYRSDAIAAGASADITWFPGAELEEETAGGADYNAVVLGFGPWAYWKLSEPQGSLAAIDSSGHGRTLDIDTGHVTMGEPGLVPTEPGQTCAFSIYTTASNVLNFHSSATQTFGASVCTVEHWINTGGASGHEQNLSCMGTIGSPTSFLWRCYLTTGGQMAFQFQGTDLASHGATGAVGVSLNTLHHCVYVMDGTNIKFYIDGVLGDTQPAGIAMNGPLTNTVFLCQPSGGAGSRDYDGFMGPVVVYDQVLSAAEIASLYANGTGTTSGGGVASVTAGDSSITIGGTALNPTVETASIDVIATDHPTAADWSNNSHKITSVTDPTNAQDAATKNYVDTHSTVSPLTTKGDIFGHSTVDARIPVGLDTQVLTADSTQALGVKWAAAASPLTTKGDLFGYSSAAARVPVGSDGQALVADSAQTLGVKWATIGGTTGQYPWWVTLWPFSYSASVGTWAWAGLGTQAYLGFWQNTSNAQNDYLEWANLTLGAGTWSFFTFAATGNTSAICTFLLDGSSVGTSDFYSAATTPNVIRSVTGVTVSTDGNHTLRLQAATRNASSTGWHLQFTAVWLQRTA